MEAADRSAVPEEGAVDHAADPETSEPRPEPEVAKAELNGKFEVEFVLNEADDSPIVLTFDPPDSALWWDVAAVQNAGQAGNFGPVFGFLQNLLGAGQVRAVRDKVAESDLSPADGAQRMFELMENIAVESGLNPGKSQASSES